VIHTKPPPNQTINGAAVIYQKPLPLAGTTQDESVPVTNVTDQTHL